ncbi:MAG: hypothetical protein AAF488_05675, partial [Planctomycetota bacterium]
MALETRRVFPLRPQPAFRAFGLPLLLGLLWVGAASAAPQVTKPASKPAADDAPPAKAEAVFPPIRVPMDGPAIDLSTLSLLASEPWEFPKDDGDALIGWIREKRGGMPEDVRDLPQRGEALEEVQRLVDNLLIAAWHHRKNFPEHAGSNEVLALICEFAGLNEARFVFSQNARQKAEFGANLAAPEVLDLVLRYYRPLVHLAVEGLTQSTSKPEQSKFLDALGVAHLSVGTRYAGAQGYDAAAVLRQTAADYFALSIEFDPRPTYAIDNSIKLIDTLLAAGATDRAAAESRKFMTKWPESRYWPHVFYFLNKALRRGGRLTEALEAWKKYGPVLEAGANGEPLPEWHRPDGVAVPEEERMTYGLYGERNTFYLGFYEFALGRTERALALLQQFTVEANELEAEGRLQMPGKVFRDNMAFSLIDTLRNLVGKPAPKLELNDGWVTPPPAKDDAKLTLVLFCDLSRAQTRHRELFAVLNSVASDYWGKGVRLRWVSAGSRRAEDHAEIQKQRMQQFAIGAGFVAPG